MKAAASGGLVVDGSVRDLKGLSQIPMPAYFRQAHPTAISQVMISGINVPVRIGGVTVMPGDLVVGDREGKRRRACVKCIGDASLRHHQAGPDSKATSRRGQCRLDL